MVQTREACELLEQWGFDLLAPGDTGSAEEPALSKPVIIAANKADMDGALDAFQEFEEEMQGSFPVIMTSALEEVGIEEMAEAIFEALGVIRVYPKSPRLKLEEFERERPLVLPMGSTVMQRGAGASQRAWRWPQVRRAVGRLRQVRRSEGRPVPRTRGPGRHRTALIRDPVPGAPCLPRTSVLL